MILFAQQMSRTDKVIVGILVIGVVGYATDRIFGALISIFLKGSGENGAPAVTKSNAHAHQTICHGVGKHNTKKLLSIGIFKHSTNLQKLLVTAGKALYNI